jgi:hypothetical protein
LWVLQLVLLKFGHDFVYHVLGFAGAFHQLRPFRFAFYS